MNSRFLGPGECVGDYVPFYFAPRSPMLFAIHMGGVDGYNRGQSEVVHLVSSAEAVEGDPTLKWVFADGHAEMAPLTKFYDDLDDLNKIDWNVMTSIYWNDTNEHPDRKRRRQAEFLVHRFFPWNLIANIGVYDQAAAEKVQEIFEESKYRPDVFIQRAWYY